jgi:ornithine cyclodeaminase/alanine dehydrogenase-like protein (mu-crystallin family)
VLVLSAGDVRRALPFAECAAAMRAALTALAGGEVSQPLRTVVRPDGAAGTMMLMPSYRRASDPVYALKALCLTPSNPAAGLDAHQGIVLLSAAATGEPLAVLNASAVTEIRTAAVSAVATELLARPDADVLAIIGTGVQARSHLLAIAASRPLAEIRVAGRKPPRADAFAASVRPETHVPVRACGSAADAVSGAGIVVTATSSPVPVLERGWLSEGTHVNAVGAHTAGTRELDGATVAAAAFFADSRESVRSESGDFLLALADGLIGPDHIRAELGEVLTGQAPGRTGPQQITVFESLGLAVEDLAAASLAYRRASTAGLGCDVDF